MAREGDLQLGPDGRWRVFHKMIGAGHQGQWVYSPEMDSWLRNTVGATRVEGSGGNMKLYGGFGPDDKMVLDLRDPGQFREYASMYNQQFGESGDELAQRAAEQGAPVDLEELWKRIYGPDTPFPNIQQRNWSGVLIPNSVDLAQFNGVIEAMEARVGDLSKYGFNKDADYQLIPLGDQYDSDIVLSGGKVTKIGKTKAMTTT